MENLIKKEVTRDRKIRTKINKVNAERILEKQIKNILKLKCQCFFSL